MTNNQLLELWLYLCLGAPFIFSLLIYFFNIFDLYGTTYRYEIDGKSHYAWVSDGSVTPGKGPIGALRPAATAHMMVFCLANAICLLVYLFPYIEGTNVAYLFGSILATLVLGLWLGLCIIKIDFIMFLWRFLLGLKYLCALGFVIYKLYQTPI